MILEGHDPNMSTISLKNMEMLFGNNR